MSSQTETENTPSGYTGREEELQLHYIRGIDFLAHHNNTAKVVVWEPNHHTRKVVAWAPNHHKQ